MIIHIDQNTRQKNILDELARSAGNSGPLRISVNSLPIYLSTKIAFNIFNYRLRSYPREIIWIALDTNILDLLHKSDLTVDKDYYIVNSFSVLNKPALEVSGLLEKKESELDLRIDIVELPEPKIDNNQIELVATPFQKEEPNNEFEEYEVDSITNLQNLDSWLERIEATKIALDELKTEEASKVFGFSDFVKSIDFSPSNIVKSAKKKRPRGFNVLSSVFAVAVSAILILVSFPTNVFTLEVVPQEIESSINLSMPISSFSKKTLKISKEASKPASGADKETTERAVGKVTIINNSFKDFKLNTNDVYFEKGANKYYLLNDSTVSNFQTIPAQNENDTDKPEFNIQSEDSGDDYSIGSNERLEIYNSLGQNVCGNCFAITTTQVKGQLSEGGKVVTEADQDLLRSTIEGLQAVERLKEIDALKNENVFVDSTWYKNLDSVFVYDHQLGDAAKDVSLKVDVTTSILYLPRSMIEEILKNENQEIKEIKNIVLKSTEGGFIDEENEIDLEFLFSYVKDDKLDKKEITKELKNADTSLIHEKYPNVRRVQKKELGFDIPFVSPRVDIKIVEAN